MPKVLDGPLADELTAMDRLETQMDQIKQMSIEHYLATQTGEQPAAMSARLRRN